MKSEVAIRAMSQFLGQLAVKRGESPVDKATSQMLRDLGEVLVWVLEDAPIPIPFEGDVIELLEGFERDVAAAQSRLQIHDTIDQPPDGGN